jgi:hypothetical protein
MSRGHYVNLVGQRFGTRTVISRGPDFPSKGAKEDPTIIEFIGKSNVIAEMNT